MCLHYIFCIILNIKIFALLSLHDFRTKCQIPRYLSATTRLPLLKTGKDYLNYYDNCFL